MQLFLWRDSRVAFTVFGRVYMWQVHVSCVCVVMVQRLPSVDMYKLLTAAYAGLMACLCSWAVFIMPHGHGANMTVSI